MAETPREIAAKLWRDVADGKGSAHDLSVVAITAAIKAERAACRKCVCGPCSEDIRAIRARGGEGE